MLSRKEEEEQEKEEEEQETNAHLRLELEKSLLSGLALRLPGLGLLSHPRQLPAHLVAGSVPRRPLGVHPLFLELQEALVASGVPADGTHAGGGRYLMFCMP